MKPEIIAEIGSAHGGDVTKAKELIIAAKEAGADWAKFQWIYAHEILHPKINPIRLWGKDVALFSHFKKLERDATFYQELQECCQHNNIGFLCTAFGKDSAKQLYELGIDMIKVASPELNHLPLLKQIRTFNLPVLISTGVSLLSDIEEALEILNDNVTLLHCVTAYPTAEHEYNLNLIYSLRHIFGIPVGVSDHTVDPEIVPVLATVLNAHYIEKHITLDKKGEGLDDPMALEVDGFRQMARAVEEIAKAMQADNDNQYCKHDNLTLIPKHVYPLLAERYGEKRISAVLGSGKKKLAPSEQAYYFTSRRSLTATRDIPRGSVIESSAVSVLRAEQGNKPGLHPRYLDVIVGCKTSRDIQSGRGLSWDDIL